MIENKNTVIIFVFVLIGVFVGVFVYNKKEDFCDLLNQSSHVPEYLHKSIKPFGYGYRPYYGYNTYMYSNASNLSYSRPIYVPIYDYNYDINKTYSFPFKLYGMY